MKNQKGISFLNIGKKLLDPNSVIESHLTKEEKRIAKEEMLDYEEYIEAEERDDDYLDTDED